jgi:hypothetical protein
VKRLPFLHSMPRADRDIRRCLAVVGREPLRNPSSPESDLSLGIARALAWPEANPADLWRSTPGIRLRRAIAGQFVIFYTYSLPFNGFPYGIVSIRAVRHSRVKEVFSGVGERVTDHAPSPG